MSCESPLLRSARKLLESCPGGEKHTSGSGMFITNVLTSLRDRGAGCRSRHSHRGYQFGPCNNGSWPHGFPGEGFSGVPKSFVHWRRTGVSRTRWVGQPLRSLRGPSPWRSAQLRLRNYSLAQEDSNVRYCIPDPQTGVLPAREMLTKNLS